MQYKMQNIIQNTKCNTNYKLQYNTFHYVFISHESVMDNPFAIRTLRGCLQCLVFADALQRRSFLQGSKTKSMPPTKRCRRLEIPALRPLMHAVTSSKHSFLFAVCSGRSWRNLLCGSHGVSFCLRWKQQVYVFLSRLMSSVYDKWCWVWDRVYVLTDWALVCHKTHVRAMLGRCRAHAMVAPCCAL